MFLRIFILKLHVIQPKAVVSFDPVSPERCKVKKNELKMGFIYLHFSWRKKKKKKDFLSVKLSQHVVQTSAKIY